MGYIVSTWPVHCAKRNLVSKNRKSNVLGAKWWDFDSRCLSPTWMDFRIVQEMHSWVSTIIERFKRGRKTHPESEPNHSGRGQGTVVAAAFTSAP